MVQSYTQNPSFGDPKDLQDELDSVILKVQKLEYEFHALDLELSDVNHQLEQKKVSHRNPLITPQTIQKPDFDSPEGSRASSAGYGTISSTSDKNSDTGIGVEVHDEFASDNIEKVMALYPYSGECGDTSIAMEAGEEFIAIEGDEDGWTKVRRKSKNTNSKDLEGFVPTAYLQCL